MLTKSELKNLFLKHDFHPSKRLGQNYLIDGNIKDKIIEAAGIKRGDAVLEIGPGLGALTADLAAVCASLHAVEKDTRAFRILKEELLAGFPDVKLYNEDILKFDLKKITPGKNLKIIGNLPYYITSPIIEYFIKNKRYINSIVITIQREVANRLMASPGTKDYGSLSCFVRYHMRASYIYTIRRTSFFPEPEVDSSIIRLDVLPAPSVKVEDEEKLFKIIRGSFNQRRKTILNSLSRAAVLNMSKENLTSILTTAGVDPLIRPESLSLTDFARISNAV